MFKCLSFTLSPDSEAAEFLQSVGCVGIESDLVEAVADCLRSPCVKSKDASARPVQSAASLEHMPVALPVGLESDSIHVGITLVARFLVGVQVGHGGGDILTVKV